MYVPSEGLQCSDALFFCTAAVPAFLAMNTRVESGMGGTEAGG